MDYKELSSRLRRRYLDSLGNVVLQKPADVYNDCNHAATAITDLLARAEAAESRAEKAERERDEAVADLKLTSDCRVCGNLNSWCSENPDKCKGWKWRGQKEE